MEIGEHRPLRRLGACLVTILLLVLLVACSRVGSVSASVPRVGVIVPRSGEHRDFGDQFLRGLELSCGEKNGAVELVPVDDRGDPGLAADLVRRLVEESDVVAIIGSVTTSCCLAAAERAELLNVPLVSPAGTNARIGKGRRWVFQTCFTDAQQGARMATFAREARHLERVAILTDVTTDYSIGLASAFEETFVRAGGQIADEMHYRTNRVDPAEVTRFLEHLDCDAVFIPGYYSDAASVVGETYSLWSKRPITFLGGDGWDSPEIRQSGASWPEAVFISNHFAPDDGSPDVRDFCRRYAERYGDATPSSLAALSYDAGRLLLSVIESGASTRDALRAGLSQSLARAPFRGVTGSLGVDPSTSERKKEIKIQQWLPSEKRWKSL